MVLRQKAEDLRAHFFYTRLRRARFCGQLYKMHGVPHRRIIRLQAEPATWEQLLDCVPVATRRECAVTSLCEVAALYQHTKAGHGTSWRQLTQEQRRVFAPGTKSETVNLLAGDAERALHARAYGLASIQASSASCSPDNLDAPALRLREQIADCFLRCPDVDRSGDRLRDFVKQDVLGEQPGHVKQERQGTMNVPAALAEPAACAL